MSTRNKIPVSVIIMTRNEERVLPHTLKSVVDFDQVFVVDSHSDDNTCSIAASLKAEVVHFTWDGQYPKKKEWSLLNLPFRNDWVLYLDADELVTPALARELRELLLTKPEHAAFDVQLDYFFLGRLLKHGHKVNKRALMDRTKASWPHVDDLAVANMWEVEGHYQPNIDGSIGHLTGRLEHNDRDPLYDYFARHNRYSDWEAHLMEDSALAKSVKGSRSKRGNRYAILPFKPAAFFIYSYFVRRGFLDGKPGFHYAIAHAFYFWQISIKGIEAKMSSPSTAQRKDGNDTPPMRVVQICASLSPHHGGPTEAALNLNRALRDRGTNARILSTDEHGDGYLSLDRQQMLAESGASIVFYRSHWPRKFKASYKMMTGIKKFIRQSNVVHIHGFYIWQSIVAAHYATRYNIPYIVQPHGVFEPYQARQSKTIKRIFHVLGGNRALLNAAMIAFDTDVERDQAQLPASATGIAKTIIPPAPQSHSLPLRSNVSHSASLNILFLARIAPKKRVDLVISAMPSLLKLFPQAHLSIAGSDSQDLVKASLSALSPTVRNSISFVGFAEGDSKERLFHEADVYILPSENENFGISVTEALHAGLPVIISKNVALHEEIVQAGAGIALDDLTSKAIVSAVEIVMKSPENWKAMSERAKFLAVSKYSQDLSVSSALNSYSRALVTSRYHS